MINVTKTYLSDIDKFKAYVDSIYASGWITNHGLLVGELEQRLKDYTRREQVFGGKQVWIGRLLW